LKGKDTKVVHWARNYLQWQSSGSIEQYDWVISVSLFF